MNSSFLALTGFEEAVAEAMAEAEVAGRGRQSSPHPTTVHGPRPCKAGEGLLEMAFEEADMLGPQLPSGNSAVRCPWEVEHSSGETFDGSTVLFSPTAGSDFGFFHCSHTHCEGRSVSDVLNALPEEAVTAAHERLFAERSRRSDAFASRFMGSRPFPSSAKPGAGSTDTAANDVHVGTKAGAPRDVARSDGSLPVESETPQVSQSVTDEHLTDVGNAERLVGHFGRDLRYVHSRGSWLLWDGKRWEWDERGVVDFCAKATIRDLFTDAGEVKDDTKRRELLSHAYRSEDVRRLAAMVKLARSEPGIPVVQSDLDADDWLLNVENGVLDLKTGDLRPHDQNLLMTKLAPVTFDPAATAPVWAKFVNTIFANDADLISYVQRVCGYALTGSIVGHILVFFYGLGANGKSTFLESISGLMGGYAAQAAPNLLIETKNERHPTEVADLQGRRLVVSSEVEQGKKLSEALVKQLTGGDTLKGRFMRGDFFEFRPTHKLFLMANHKPVVHGNDEGIWRRIKLVPFNVVIPDGKRDRKLMAKLAAERSGILNWLLQGCLEWQKHGLAASKAVEDATGAYREEMDRIAGFIQDECVLGAATSRAADLYRAYMSWCDRNGDSPVQQKTFGSMLRERGFAPVKQHGYAAWRGLRLKLPDETSDA